MPASDGSLSYDEWKALSTPAPKEATSDGSLSYDEWKALSQGKQASIEINTGARSFGEKVGDAASQLAKGVNTIAGAIPSLLDPSSPVSKFFNDNAQYWQNDQSQITKSLEAAADARIKEAAKTGQWEAFKTAVSEYGAEPALVQKLILENIPSMIPGLAAAKGAQIAAKGSVIAGTVAGAGTNSVLNAGGARQESYQDIKSTLIAQGVPEAEADAQALEKSRVAAGVGAVTGALSGGSGLERGILGGAKGGFARRAGIELGGEQLEEVAPTIATNMQLDRGLMTGVGETSAKTLIASSPGSVLSGFHGNAQPQPQPPGATPPPGSPPPPDIASSSNIDELISAAKSSIDVELDNQTNQDLLDEITTSNSATPNNTPIDQSYVPQPETVARPTINIAPDVQPLVDNAEPLGSEQAQSPIEQSQPTDLNQSVQEFQPTEGQNVQEKIPAIQSIPEQTAPEAGSAMGVDQEQVNNGTASTYNHPALDSGSSTGASTNAAGSNANGILRYDSATGARRNGMLGTVVGNDGASGVSPNGGNQPSNVGNQPTVNSDLASTLPSNPTTQQSPSTPLPVSAPQEDTQTSQPATLSSTENIEAQALNGRAVAAKKAIKGSYDILINQKSSVKSTDGYKKMLAAVESAMETGNGNTKQFKLYASGYKKSNPEVSKALTSIAKALEPAPMPKPLEFPIRLRFDAARLGLNAKDYKSQNELSIAIAEAEHNLSAQGKKALESLLLEDQFDAMFGDKLTEEEVNSWLSLLENNEEIDTGTTQDPTESGVNKGTQSGEQDRDAAQGKAQSQVIDESVATVATDMTDANDAVVKTAEVIAQKAVKPKRKVGTPKRMSMLQFVASEGGFNRDSIASEIGRLDDMKRHKSGIFGSPTFRVKGGMHWDKMGERLAEYGYLPKNEHGQYDKSDLAERLNAELDGEMQYTFDDVEDIAQSEKENRDFDELRTEAERLGIDWKKHKTIDDLWIAIDAKRFELIDADEALLEDAVASDSADTDFDFGTPVSAAETEAWLNGVENEQGNQGQVNGTSTGTQGESNQRSAERGSAEGEAQQQATDREFTLTSQTEEGLRRQEEAAKNAQQKEERATKDDQAAQDKADLDARKKKRADNPDNFVFGESSKDAVKPMGDIFNQPTNPSAEKASNKIGDLVKLTKPGLNGRVNISGTISKILPDGRLEIKTQQDGYMTVTNSELGHKPKAEAKPQPESKPTDPISQMAASVESLAKSVQTLVDNQNKLADTETLDIDGYIETLPSLNQPQANKLLKSKSEKEYGRKADVIKNKIDNGYSTKITYKTNENEVVKAKIKYEEYRKTKNPNREKLNELDKLVDVANNTPVYKIGKDSEGWKEISKTEYNFANWLTENKNTVDASTKPENVDTSEERVQAIDTAAERVKAIDISTPTRITESEVIRKAKQADLFQATKATLVKLANKKGVNSPEVAAYISKLKNEVTNKTSNAAIAQELLDDFDAKIGNASLIEPQVLTFEQFAAMNDASRQSIGEAALHRSSNKKSPNTHRKDVERQAKKDTALIDKRESLRAEYARLLENGSIREPSAKEKTIATANGHADNDATQAARRIADKRGWNWQEADSDSLPKLSKSPPTQNNHTVASATSSMLDAHTGRIKSVLQAMLDSGKAKVVTAGQAAEVVGEDALSSDAQAFYNPADEVTYFVADQISVDYTAEQFKGLVLHEIAVHAKELGKDSKEFKSILVQVDMMHKSGNKAVNAAFTRASHALGLESVVAKGVAQRIESHTYAASDILSAQAGIQKLLDKIFVEFSSGVGGEVHPMSSKQSLDSSSTAPNDLADLLIEHPAITQRLSSLDIKTQKVVLSLMSGIAQNSEVFNSIVEFIPVDVMNVLVSGELTSNAALHDMAVFIDLNTVNSDNPIATSINVAGRIAKAITGFARLGTKNDAVGTNISRGGNAKKLSTASAVGQKTRSLGLDIADSRTERANPDSGDFGVGIGNASGTIDNRHDVTPSSDVGLGGATVQPVTLPPIISRDTLLNEQLAYLLQESPSLSIVQRVIAWFRNAIRAIGKSFPTLQRLKLHDWAKNLSESDLRFMAESALKNSDRSGAQNESDTPQFSKQGNTININGVERSRLNSNGKPIANTDEAIRNSWEWFGDSKVVDSENRPLVVYHGSDEERSVIEPGYKEPGAWFTSDKQNAANYARGNDAYLHDVYLRAENPLIADFSSWNLDKAIEIEGKEFQDNVEIVKYAQRNGYDSVNFPVGNFSESDNTWVVFNSNQVKSATGNNGNFSKSDNNILFSKNTNPITHPFQPENSGKPLDSWIKIFTRNQIVTLYRDSLIGKQLEEYKELRELVTADTNKLYEKADNFLLALRQIPKGLRDAFASLAHDSTLNNVDPSNPQYVPSPDAVKLASYLTNPSNQTLAAKIKKRLNDMESAHKKLHAEFKLLPAKEQALFKELRSKYTEQMTMVFDEFKNRIGRMKNIDPAIKASSVKKLDEQLADLLGRVYFPLYRAGNYIVKAEKVGEPTTVDHVESNFTADRLEKKLKKLGYTVSRSTRIVSPQDNKSGEALNTVRDLLDKAALKGKIEGAELAQLMDDIDQTILQSLPDQSYRKSFIHRKGTKGYSDDFIRAYADAMRRGSINIANLRHGDKITTVIEDMRKDVKAASKVPGSNVAALNQVVDRVEQIEVDIRNPTSKLVSVSGKIAFAQMLGSLSNFILNITQTPLLTMPHLGAEYGYGKANLQLAMAYAKQMRSLKKQGTLSELGKWLDMRHGLVGNELDLMQQLHDSGFLDLTQSFDLIDAANNPSYQENELSMNVMKVIALPQHVSEIVNRQVTALATIRLEMARSGSPLKAYRAAIKSIDQTHFNYSKENRAKLMTGNTQSILFRFKQYSQQAAFLFVHTAKLALDGSTKLDSDGNKLDGTRPSERTKARKQLAGVLGMQILAAGMLGLPVFTEAAVAASGVAGFKLAGSTSAYVGVAGAIIIAAALAFGDDDGEEFDVEVKKWFIQHFGKDVGSSLASGVIPRGLSTRLDASQLVIRRPEEKRTATDTINAWMLSLLGAFWGGTVYNAGVGLKDIVEGDTAKGATKLIPVKAIKDLVTSWKWANDGMNVTNKDGEIITPVSKADLFFKGIGINPTSVVNAREYENAKHALHNALLKKQQKALTEMRNETDKTKRFDSIIKYNKSAPLGYEIDSSKVHDVIAREAKYKGKPNVVTGNPVQEGYLNKNTKELRPAY